VKNSSELKFCSGSVVFIPRHVFRLFAGAGEPTATRKTRSGYAVSATRGRISLNAPIATSLPDRTPTKKSSIGVPSVPIYGTSFIPHEIFLWN
jgi:hypothetical protein